MRKTLLTLVLSVLFISVFSQQDSVLQNFKFRTSNYRAVYVNINGGGQLYNNNYGSGKNKSNAASGSLGTGYYFIKSTDRILLNSSGAISSSFFSGKNENTGSVSVNKSKSSSAALHFSLTNQWFTNKFFTELGVDLSSGFNGNKTNSTNPAGSSKNNQFDQSLAITGGIGKGRPENITDMQNALWLTDALAAENKLSRPLSPSELNELGSTITKSNNTRILDSRRRTRFVLGLIDKYFQEKGLVNTPDISYFSNLNDILFFAFNMPRLSGTEKYIRLTPAITHVSRNENDYTYLTKNETRSTTKSVLLSTGFSKYHPVNLRHQNDYGISLMLNYISNDYTAKYYNAGVPALRYDLNPEIKQAGMKLFFDHSIYPNTRTIIDLGLRSEAGYQDLDDGSGFFGMVNVSGTFNYFISYRTRFTGSLGAVYLNNFYNYSQYLELVPDNLQLYANAGIVVSL